MRVKDIISLIPEELLAELALKNGSNKYSKKLSAEIIFKLLLHCILSYKDNSLRRMSSEFESIIFALISEENVGSISHSSISERLSKLDSSFFKDLYHRCVEIYGREIASDNKKIIYDSTIVSLSSRLLHIGYNLKGGDASKLNLIKYSVGLTEIPSVVNIYTDLQYSSENQALGETVKKNNNHKDVIRVFDRGINNRDTYDQLISEGILFVSRVNPNCKNKIVKSNTLSKAVETDTLIIYSDEQVFLYAISKRKAKNAVRLIKTRSKETNEEIWFVTSIVDGTSIDITEVYKQRWEIEVFFKFLKQELNFSHFLNRSQNGIEIILYCTLIASMLLLVYKHKNKLTGYKIMKQKFMQELEAELIKHIVILSGGSLHKLGKLNRFYPP